MTVVLDALSVLAILFDETGSAAVVAGGRGGIISAVNFAEVLEKFAKVTGSADPVNDLLAQLEIAVVAFDPQQARIAADLKPKVGRNDSMADRACLALAIHRRLPVLTADTAWAELNLGLDIRLIR